jgi:hypothetical protein
VIITLRAARPDDYGFAKQIYYETMRWIIERLFDWDEEREDRKFAEQFKLEEVRIITADGRTSAGFKRNRPTARSISGNCMWSRHGSGEASARKLSLG